MKEVARKNCDREVFDHSFQVDGNQELCHSTGYEVLMDMGTDIDGNPLGQEWWDEFEDSNGDLHYSN